MSIEFRCPHCQRLLRVPDGSHGKQAQCPQCQAMVQVPAPGAAPPAANPAPAANPFATNLPAAASAPPSDNPYQAPASPFTANQASASAVVYPLVPTKMDLGDVLNRTWEIYKSQLGMVILVVFAVAAINWGASMISSIILQAVNAAANDPGVFISLQALFQIVLMVFQIWLGLGQLRFMLKIARGQPAEFTDIFTGGPFVLTAVLGSLVIGLGILAMLLPFAVIPGIAWLATNDKDVTLFAGLGAGVLAMPVLIFIGLSISQFQPLIVDRQLGVMDSLRTSNEIMSGNRLMMFVLVIVLGLLNMVGLLACCIGALFTGAYSGLAIAVMYLIITGQPTADQLMRGAPPPMPANT